jgi:hypothetical protein
MPKQVRFSPSVAPPAPLSPHDNCALIMLDLKSGITHRSASDNFSNTSDNHSAAAIISPNDDEPRSTRCVRDPAFPSLPFDDDDSQFDSATTMQPDAKRFKSTNNPLDLLSTVSLQLAPEALPAPNSQRSPAPTALRTPLVHDSSLEQGCKLYPNGSTYLGHFLNGSRHGFGICHYPTTSSNGQAGSSHVFTGLWKNGKREGLGTMKYANRNSYEGMWANDCQEGRGVFHYSDGSADVALWTGIHCIYGVRWDASRQYAWMLFDGGKGEMISRDQALEMGRDVGIEGIPERMMQI